RRPTASRIAVPGMLLLPRAPTAVTERSRPETPRRKFLNRTTVPMSPVYRRRSKVTEPAGNVTLHRRDGLALVKSPGSQTPRRYGRGAPVHTFWLFSV